MNDKDIQQYIHDVRLERRAIMIVLLIVLQDIDISKSW